MRWTIIALAGTVALLTGIAGADPAELKVCSDPDNLPYSNERQEGFENKIAEIVAKDLGASLTNFWWPHQRGLVRNTLRADKCDVLIDIPKGYDPVTWTKPYYRSAYVLVTKTDGGPKVTSLDDPAMKQVKRIGVHMNTPPSDALGDRGLQDNMRTYITFNDPRDPDPERRPLKMLEDVAAGEIDEAVAWGPRETRAGSTGSISRCCGAGGTRQGLGPRAAGRGCTSQRVALPESTSHANDLTVRRRISWLTTSWWVSPWLARATKSPTSI